MRIALRVLGLDLFDFEISTDDAESSSPDADLSGGTTSSYPVGFTPSWERPREPGTDYE